MTTGETQQIFTVLQKQDDRKGEEHCRNFQEDYVKKSCQNSAGGQHLNFFFCRNCSKQIHMGAHTHTTHYKHDKTHTCTKWNLLVLLARVSFAISDKPQQNKLLLDCMSNSGQPKQMSKYVSECKHVCLLPSQAEAPGSHVWEREVCSFFISEKCNYLFYCSTINNSLTPSMSIALC